ncbi:hypothetical protein EDB84DRAFT_1509504 [Lactarius hengduanensis]|nr:hypothetical protein EDB84DRAFT_1509504 [Lactarius hengduanensis]
MFVTMIRDSEHTFCIASYFKSSRHARLLKRSRSIRAARIRSANERNCIYSRTSGGRKFEGSVLSPGRQSPSRSTFTARLPVCSALRFGYFRHISAESAAQRDWGETREHAQVSANDVHALPHSTEGQNRIPNPSSSAAAVGVPAVVMWFDKGFDVRSRRMKRIFVRTSSWMVALICCCILSPTLSVPKVAVT